MNCATVSDMGLGYPARPPRDGASSGALQSRGAAGKFEVMEVGNRETVLVLEEDSALGEVVPAGSLERARLASIAVVLRRPTGTWNAADDSELARGGFGL